MNYPNTWQALADHETVNPVQPVRTFRIGDPDYLQFTDTDSNEYVAVHSTRPYGAVETLPESVDAQLLTVEGKGDDYSWFKLPADVIGLQQASLGNGRGDVPGLSETYAHLGRVVRQLLDAMPLPALSLNDFGIIKRTGELLLLPPLSLGEGSRNPLIQLNSLSESVAASVPATTYDSLIAEISRGVTGS